MKKYFMYLTLACYVLTSNAMTFSGHEKDKKEKSENSVQQKKNFYLFLPLGIEDLNLVGARTKGRCDKVFFFPANKDATRFLEKAVQENDVEKAEKLLKAGASAYVSYDMIKNKQYEMIDAMHKDNPKLIRYSQMLHYACATSDTTMIDFLIDRNASLDLCGYCEAKGGRGYWGVDSERSKWNGDNRFANTPADVALMYSQWTNLYYIINKYHKYPTINGCTRFFTLILKYNPNLVDLLKKFGSPAQPCV